MIDISQPDGNGENRYSGKPRRCPTVEPGDRIMMRGGPLDGLMSTGERARCLQVVMLLDLPGKPMYVASHRDEDGVIVYEHLGSAAHLLVEGE